MAFKNPNTFFLLLFLSSILLSTLAKQGLSAKETALLHALHDLNLKPKGWQREWIWRRKETSARRLMIGSTAPTCTYNECRGCRFKCRAEQVPVDANDPVNSAYRYRCVCHR